VPASPPAAPRSRWRSLEECHEAADPRRDAARGNGSRCARCPAGARAQFKGIGTINGAGSYGFILTAIDGDLAGGGGTDRFRIKITGPGGGIVYDNQMGAADDSDAAMALGGGSIVIHR